MNKNIAAVVEKLTGVPAAVTQKVADRIADSGMLEPKNVQQQVNAARMIGKMAVQFGSQKLAAKLQDISSNVAASSSTAQMPTQNTEEAATSDIPVANADVVGGDSVLPISDYASRKALDITAQLSGLSGEQLLIIAEFESANRARRTILAKIDQLLAR